MIKRHFIAFLLIPTFLFSSEDEEIENETTEKTPLNCEQCATSVKQLIHGSIEDLQTKLDELTERIDSLESGQESVTDLIEEIQQQPSEAFLAKSNLLLAGTAYTFFTAPRHLNETFGTVIDPVFLWRWGDRFLFEMKLDISLINTATRIDLVFGTADYIVTDWLIARAGKFSLPLGLVWEKMTTGWINKLPNLPLPYNPRIQALTPAADVGLDLRGAIPLPFCYGEDCCKCIPFVLAYDFWIGNGPDQLNRIIDLAANGQDNNHNRSLGTRIAIRPQPFREIGFSFMRASWNNNEHAGLVISNKNLYYNAFVIDLNWRLTDNSKLMGEYIWTQFDAVLAPDFGIDKCSIHEQGFWIQYSSFLGSIGKCFEKFEFVTRYCFVDSDIEDHWGTQLSFGLNYHIYDVLILKNAIDINHGKRIPPGLVYTVQLACAF